MVALLAQDPEQLQCFICLNTGLSKTQRNCFFHTCKPKIGSIFGNKEEEKFHFEFCDMLRIMWKKACLVDVEKHNFSKSAF